MKIVAGAEEVEPPEKKHEGSESHVREQNLRRSCSLLASLVNLRSSNRLGIRKFGVFHHDAAEESDEEHAECAADYHQCNRFPVLRACDAGGQRWPQSCHHESGDREYRTRRD